MQSRVVETVNNLLVIYGLSFEFVKIKTEI